MASFSFLPSAIVTTQVSPGGGSALSAKIDFRVAPQAETQWCWAAVSSSISKYFDINSPWTQCKVATGELASSCCEDRDPCNRWWYLDKALERTQNLNEWFTGTLDMPTLTAELTSKRPVCIRIEWPGGSGHFLAVTGLYQDTSGSDRVLLSDPIFGTSSYTVEDLISGSYQNDQGRWTHTYLTRR